MSGRSGGGKSSTAKLIAREVADDLNTEVSDARGLSIETLKEFEPAFLMQSGRHREKVVVRVLSVILLVATVRRAMTLRSVNYCEMSMIAIRILLWRNWKHGS